MMRRFAVLAERLRSDTSGVALLEFALTLPILLLLSLTGAELTNYITTKMRISQISLHLADNAARIGSGTQLSLKTISESDINDLFTGAQLQSGELDLNTNGRIILSSVEPDPSNSGKYKIVWQRCKGLKTTHASTYGLAGANNLTGVGPVGRQTVAPASGVAMFVEVYYVYQPLVKASISPSSDMTEIASMMVRDRRDTSDDTATTNLHPKGVYKVTGVTASSC